MSASSDVSGGLKKRPAPEDDDPAASSAKKSKATNGLSSTQSAAKRKAKAAPELGMCSLNKKEFGDRIKECLRLEKYDIQSMSFNVQMDVVWFRQFFDNGAGVRIVPSTYDDSTSVVVATLSNTAAGSLFGVTKIKNGNRYSTFHLAKMVVILYPAERRAEAWVTV